MFNLNFKLNYVLLKNVLLKKNYNKLISCFEIVFILCFFIFLNSCNNINNNLLKESSSLLFKIDWNNSKNNRLIPEQTDYIIVSLYSLELENYKKTIQIQKNDNTEKVISLFPGNYNIVIFATSKELNNDKIYYKIITTYSTSFEIAPDENKIIDSNLEQFNIVAQVSNLLDFKIGDTFYFYLTIPDLKNYIDIYSFYYILDFNKNGGTDSGLIKKIRVTKGNIEMQNSNDGTLFKITCLTSIEDFLDTEAKLGYKVEFRMDKDYFADEFFDENNIYKIYYYFENYDFTTIQDHQDSGNLSININ